MFLKLTLSCSLVFYLFILSPIASARTTPHVKTVSDGRKRWREDISNPRSVLVYEQSNEMRNAFKSGAARVPN